MNGAPRLSLAMIVRDAAHCVADALLSAKSYVDEMVVVDTGSVDNTTELVRECGASVIEMAWPDSFAEARNESLRHATGDWILWMDADDVLPAECGSRLRELVRSSHPSDVEAFVMQVHCPPVSGAASDEVTVVDHVKVFRNGRGYRFKGRIHEQVLWSIREMGGRVEWTDLFVVHENSETSSEGLARKIERDLRLLNLELKDHPTSSFALFNLGMTLEAAGRLREAIDVLSRAAVLSRNDESHVRKLYAILASCWAKGGHLDAAERVVERGLRAFPGDPELSFRMGSVMLRTGRPAEAARMFRAVLGARPERQFSSFDRSILSRKAYGNLALALDQMGRFDECVQSWLEAARACLEDEGIWFGLADTCARNARLSQQSFVVGRLEGTAAPGWIRMFAAGLDAAFAQDEAGAVELLDGAHESSGQRAEVLEFICRGVFEAQPPALAVRYLRKLLALRPDDPAVLHNLGAALHRRGEGEEALRLVARSLELRPDAPQTLALRDSIRAAGGVAVELQVPRPDDGGCVRDPG